MALYRFTILASLTLSCWHFCFSQSSRMEWSGFGSGVERSRGVSTMVTSVIGEAAVGRSVGGNSMIESGFLVHPIIRGMVVPYVMDGRRDEVSTLLASSSGLNLYAHLLRGKLYVAVASAPSQSGDLVIFVVVDNSTTRSAPWGKSGSAVSWVAFLGSAAESYRSGWYDDQGDSLETSVASAACDTLAEGVIDLTALLGYLPGKAMIAACSYQSGAGGALTAQVPTGNGDPNLDAAELSTFLITGVRDDRGEVPTSFSLFQNYPNPFNPVTTIRYAIPKRSFVRLAVYDILGREIVRLVDGLEEPGYKTARFSGKGLASGMYFYRLSAGNFIETMKLLLVK